MESVLLLGMTAPRARAPARQTKWKIICDSTQARLKATHVPNTDHGTCHVVTELTNETKDKKGPHAAPPLVRG